MSGADAVPNRHSGASREPAIHRAMVQALKWIPGSTLRVEPGMVARLARLPRPIELPILLLIRRVGVLHRRHVEQHGRDKRVRLVEHARLHPDALGAAAARERDDLALDVIFLVDEEWPFDQSDLLVGEQA